MIRFEITHNISKSKGWGRYKASTPAGPLVTSNTGNEWVSAPHSGECADGTEIAVMLQTMERGGRMKRETINTETYRLVAQAGAEAKLGYWNGLEVTVSGAEVRK